MKNYMHLNFQKINNYELVYELFSLLIYKPRQKNRIYSH